MLSNAQLILDNQNLIKRLKLYEISTKLDHDKIEMLNATINNLKCTLKLKQEKFNIE